MKTLPYDFDLIFDIKTHQQLRQKVNDSSNELNELAEIIKTYNMENMFPDIFCSYKDNGHELYYPSCCDAKPVNVYDFEEEKYCRFCGKLIIKEIGEE